ncbi:MAG TPA: AtzE family amidohydrolase [Rhodoblastus sp.]|nr:AtzE family amidohydrolase [Rhodoblastus sp.]
MSDAFRLTASECVAAVAGGKLTATEIVDASLARIAAQNPRLNAYTAVLAGRARAKAADIDARIARGERVGPLAGATYCVKNLFDVAGVVTLAGSKINADQEPAPRDASLVRKMEAADAILLGAVNMGEYAYDFTGENAHAGASRNPHDPAHMSGGSSGGSGAAVAAGMAAISLGSDTNGSIRVPSSFCGLFGLKPTYGRLSRAGSFPFVGSLDHLGPIARSVDDLALAYDAMQGHDADDLAQAPRPVEPVVGALPAGTQGLRIARAGGYFARGGEPAAYAAVDVVCKALGVAHEIEIPEAQRARAAAFLITMAEGADLHLARLRARAQDFDPAVRDRLVAGAMLPAHWIIRAQKFRRRYRELVLQLFEEVDLVIAPATPCRAPKGGQATFVLDGVEMPVRPNIGVYTQPISFIGLPVVAVPVWTAGERLPIGVQIIAPPWREDLALRAAHALQMSGVCAAPVAE